MPRTVLVAIRPRKYFFVPVTAHGRIPVVLCDSLTELLPPLLKNLPQQRPRLCAGNPWKRCNANPPAAFPAIPPPMNQPCILQKSCSLPAPIAMVAIRPPAFLGTAPASPDYLAAKQKAHVQPKNSAFRNRSSIPERVFTKWLAESYDVHKICESRRSACRAAKPAAPPDATPAKPAPFPPA